MILGVLAVFITSILWGTTGVAASFSSASPIAIGSFSLGIGSLLQTAVGYQAIRAQRQELSKHLRLILLGGGAIFLYPLAFYSSMHLAGVAVGTVISLGSAPLFAAAIDRFIDKLQLARIWIPTIILSLTGCILLASMKSSTGTQPLLGIGAGLVAGATYALYSWVCTRLMRAGIHRKAAVGSVFGAGGLALTPVLLLTLPQHLASPTNLGIALYMALVPMFLGYVLFAYGLAVMPSSLATTITLSEPAVATLLAVVIVGETLSTQGWIGLGCIGISLILITWSTATPARRAR